MNDAIKVAKILGQDLLAGGPAGDGLMPAWLAQLKAAARDDFARLGLPQRRNEIWHYTDLTPVARQRWTPVAANENAVTLDRLPDTGLPDLPGPRVVLYQGRVQTDLSRLKGLPEGTRLASLAELMAAEPDTVGPYLGRLATGDAVPLAALNTAHLGDGAALILPAGTRLPEPVHILSFGAPAGDGSPCVFHPRLLVVAGAGSAATVIEHHAAGRSGAYFTNMVAPIFIGDDAAIVHAKIQRDAAPATHLATTQIALGNGAAYDGFLLQTGAALGRQEVVAGLGEGARFRFGGVYLGAGDQHLDTTVRVSHDAPGATSRQHVKGVLTGRAEGVYQGKIIVREGAQRTDGHQLSRALLLSDTARVRTKPELEIYADDVKCGHGATAGPLSEQALFYLTARGIDRDTARAMLIGGFVDEVLTELGDEHARGAVRALVGDWLRRETGHDWLAAASEAA